MDVVLYMDVTDHVYNSSLTFPFVFHIISYQYLQ